MEVAPLLPPIPLSNAFQLPAPTLDLPLVGTPRWVPVPPRIRDIGEPGVPNTEAPAEPVEQQSAAPEPEPQNPSPPVSNNPPVIPPPPTQFQPPLPVIPEIPTAIEPEVPQLENSITIPIIEVQMPLPSNEIMVVTATTAGVAAVVSVGGTLAAKTIFDYVLRLMKPLLKIVINKLLKMRGKKPITWARQRQLERRRK